MAEHVLSFASLPELDNGIVAAAFDRHLQIIMDDLRDRPVDNAARAINLKVEAVPIFSDIGELVDVEFRFVVTSKIPAHQTTPKRLTVRLRQTESGPHKPCAIFSDVTSDGAPSLFDHVQNDDE